MLFFIYAIIGMQVLLFASFCLSRSFPVELDLNESRKRMIYFPLQMFGNIKVDHTSTIHNHNNFQNIFQATLVLFRQDDRSSS